jgi:hypothetical protein
VRMNVASPRHHTCPIRDWATRQCQSRALGAFHFRAFDESGTGGSKMEHVRGLRGIALVAPRTCASRKCVNALRSRSVSRDDANSVADRPLRWRTAADLSLTQGQTAQSFESLRLFSVAKFLRETREREIQMKPQLLWVLMVACVCAGCASRPVSEARALASEVVRQPTNRMICNSGDIRYCDVDASGEKRCGCVEYRSLFRGH